MEWLWNFVKKDKMQWDEAQWLHHEAKNTENKDSHELKKNIKLQLLSSQLIVSCDTSILEPTAS